MRIRECSIKGGIVFIAVALIILTCLSITGTAEESRYDKAVKLGGEWFLSNQNESFLYYRYNVSKKKHSKKSNALRQLGALWSISKLANYLGDPRYEALAHRGFRHFEKHFKNDKKYDFYFLNIKPDKIKLGHSAFVILALLEMDHPKKEYYLDKFANGIISLQNTDGSLRTFFYSERTTGVDYYPGEALIALMSLYEYKKDKRYLKVVENAFPYYVQYWKSNRNTAFVPWQTRAYCKLYKATQKKEVADFVFEMSDYMLNRHIQEGSSKFDFSKGIVTAVYIEGVNKAYELAEELGDKERAARYANFVKEGIDFIMSLQITDSDNFTKKAIGGFLGSYKSKTTRVDRNQHAVMAIMESCESGVLK